MKLNLMQDSQKDKFDSLFTPEEAVIPLLKYLPKTKMKIWEPFDPGCSKFTELLTQMGHDVISTDLESNFNFLIDTPDFEFQMIISNPPYSIKDSVLQKCFEYSVPFALLLHITTFEGKRRGKMFREYGIEVLVLDSRFDFSGGGANWFNTSYFCHGILPQQLIFEQITKSPKLPLDSLTN
jgi:hypothetical protein